MTAVNRGSGSSDTPNPQTYPGRPIWAVRRHDVGDEPVVYIMESRHPGEAEEHARSMVRSMTEVAERNGWDNAPELLHCDVVWTVVEP